MPLQGWHKTLREIVRGRRSIPLSCQAVARVRSHGVSRLADSPAGARQQVLREPAQHPRRQANRTGTAPVDARALQHIIRTKPNTFRRSRPGVAMCLIRADERAVLLSLSDASNLRCKAISVFGLVGSTLPDPATGTGSVVRFLMAMGCCDTRRGSQASFLPAPLSPKSGQRYCFIGVRSRPGQRRPIR